MRCRNCGNFIENENDKFCETCGTDLTAGVVQSKDKDLVGKYKINPNQTGEASQSPYGSGNTYSTPNQYSGSGNPYSSNPYGSQYGDSNTHSNPNDYNQNGYNQNYNRGTYNQWNYSPNATSNFRDYSTAALICAIFGLIFPCLLPSSIVAIVLGSVTIKSAQSNGVPTPGAAIASIVMGIIAYVILAIIVIAYVMIIVSAINAFNDYPYALQALQSFF